MFTPARPFSFRWVAAAAAGFGFALGAGYWLTTLPLADHRTLATRSGYVCAFYCALGVGVFCWGAILAYAGRARKWSPKTCRLAGLTFLLPFALVFGTLGYPQPALVFVNQWIIGGVLTGFVCQRLVYPHVASDELNAPEPPLTLFPK